MTDAATLIRSPEKLLQHLGVSEPNDIDVEAIAQYCGATVRYGSLEGAEARILGAGDRAIITVNNSSKRGRQRFSIGHELGHWVWDRGKAAFTCDKGEFTRRWSGTDRETVANKYAAELLLPRYIFRPLVAKKPVTFQTVRELATTFETSLTATAIRLVQNASYQAMVICSSATGREWFIPGPDLDRKIWPRRDLSCDTVAYQLLTTNAESPGPTDLDADAWIDHSDAHEYVVKEDSVRIATDTVLSLLWWKNESQVMDLLYRR